jgi:hypothetical protein
VTVNLVGLNHARIAIRINVANKVDIIVPKVQVPEDTLVLAHKTQKAAEDSVAPVLWEQEDLADHGLLELAVDLADHALPELAADLVDHVLLEQAVDLADHVALVGRVARALVPRLKPRLLAKKQHAVATKTKNMNCVAVACKTKKRTARPVRKTRVVPKVKNFSTKKFILVPKGMLPALKIQSARFAP